MNRPSPRRNYSPAKLTFGSLLSILAIFWMLEALDQWVLGERLDSFGIRPRELFGLIGIPLSPFLHGGFGHLASNSIPFLALGYIVLRAEKWHFLTASATIVILGGLGTWLIGRGGSIHIGASLLIYGYFGYVMMRGFGERKVKWLVVGLVTALFFGGMVFGVLPSVGESISWEGHLCGLLAGAYLGRTRFKKS